MPHLKNKVKKKYKAKEEKKTLFRRIHFISIDKWLQFSHSFLLMLTIYRKREQKNDMKNWIKLFLFHVRDMSLLPSFCYVFYFIFYSPFSLEGFLWASEKNYADFFIAQLFCLLLLFWIISFNQQNFFSRFVLLVWVAKPKAVLKFVEWVFFIGYFIAKMLLLWRFFFVFLFFCSWCSRIWSTFSF